MDFERLLTLTGDIPLFESSLLLAGEVDPKNVRLQLTRWKNTGRIYQLRRGLYCIAPPYQKEKPHPFVVANYLVRASYVSNQSALAHYGLIPENVIQTISVTAKRPGTWETPLGTFHFYHIKPALLRGYRMIELGGDQQALIATPEKALLDLVYLQQEGDSHLFLEELRLQNLDRLDLGELSKQMVLFETPKISRSYANILSLIQADTGYVRI